MSGRFVIRELEHSDLAEVACILAEGFPKHSLECWGNRLRILAQRDPAPGTPLLGYGLDVDGLQGVGLTIGSIHGPANARQTIVNGSSWTVRQAYRGAAALELYRRSMSGRGMTFSNLSPARHTLKAIELCGFVERTAGVIIGIGAGRAPGQNRRIVQLGDACSGLAADQATTMRYHQERGCLTFCVEHRDRLAPLIFTTKPVLIGLRLAQLIYCERLSDLIDDSRLITMELWKNGYLAMLVDASGPIPGVKGRYFPGLKPRYYKGPPPLYAIDHTYSEMIYFGV